MQNCWRLKTQQQRIYGKRFSAQSVPRLYNKDKWRSQELTIMARRSWVSCEPVITKQGCGYWSREIPIAGNCYLVMPGEDRQPLMLGVVICRVCRSVKFIVTCSYELQVLNKSNPCLVTNASVLYVQHCRQCIILFLSCFYFQILSNFWYKAHPLLSMTKMGIQRLSVF
jgi:hypothetical protein